MPISLNPWVLYSLDLDRQVELLPADAGYLLGQFADPIVARHLVDDAILAGLRWRDDQTGHALHGVLQPDKATHLLSGPIDRQRHPHNRLGHETVDHSSKPLVDVKPSSQPGVSRKLWRVHPIDDTLHHVVGAQPPVLARLVHVEGVLHFADMVKAHRVAGGKLPTHAPLSIVPVQHRVRREHSLEQGPAGQGRAILAHRPQFDQGALGRCIAHGEQEA